MRRRRCRRQWMRAFSFNYANEHHLSESGWSNWIWNYFRRRREVKKKKIISFFIYLNVFNLFIIHFAGPFNFFVVFCIWPRDIYGVRLFSVGDEIETEKKSPGFFLSGGRLNYTRSRRWWRRVEAQG